MATVDTEALTTQEKVANALLRSDANDALADKVFNQNGNYSDEGVRGIHSASNIVKDYLKRDLYVSENDVLLYEEDWVEKDRTPDSDYIYRLSLPRIEEWPILSVTEDTKVWGDRKIFAQDNTIAKLNYFAGYRREDQTQLSDLPSNIEAEFSSIDDVPVLPEKIEDVVIHLAIHSAVLRLKDMIGTIRTEQRMGDFETTIQSTSYEENYRARMLNNIQSERYFI